MKTPEESGTIRVIVSGGVVQDICWAEDMRHVVILVDDRDDAKDDPANYEPGEWHAS